MAKKKIVAYIKLQIPAGKATPAPPVGPALGPHGVSAPQFVQQFNDKTKGMEPGLTVPVVITVYADKTFSFVLKTPPAAVLIKKACGIQSGSAQPHKDKVAKLSKADLKKIAGGGGYSVQDLKTKSDSREFALQLPEGREKVELLVSVDFCLYRFQETRYGPKIIDTDSTIESIEGVYELTLEEGKRVLKKL